MQLHDWNVDFAAWCSYKYLNSSPGNAGGVFVHERHGRSFDLPRFGGWWGHDKKTRFQMQPGFQPMEGAEGWQLSNVPILGMAAMIFAGLNERRREMAILRAVGAGPGTILALLLAEAALLATAGAALGVVLLLAGLSALRPYLDAAYGLYIAPSGLGGREWLVLLAVVVAGLIAGLAPAIRAYALSLADGMSVKS